MRTTAYYEKVYASIFKNAVQGLDLKNILYWPAYYCANDLLEWPASYYFKTVIKQLFNNRNRYTLQESPGASLLFFNESTRFDCVDSFSKVLSCADGQDVLVYRTVSGSFAAPATIFKRILHFLVWLFRWHGTRMNVTEFLYTVQMIQLSENFAEQIQNLDLSKYKAVVFHYDNNWVSDVLLQKAKQANCQTVTLQHGMYPTKPIFPEESEIEANRVTNADEFLAWNQLTKETVAEDGLSPDRIHIVGNPAYMDVLLPVMTRQQTDYFGVITTILPAEDKRQIKVANELAKKLNKKFYIRYHPLETPGEYDALCDPEVYAGSAQGLSIPDYLEQVSFSLVGRSTMFVDLLSRGARVYHYMDAEGRGFYKDTPALGYCGSQQVIDMEADLESTAQRYAETQKDLITPGDIRKNYTDYFKRIIET